MTHIILENEEELPMAFTREGRYVVPWEVEAEIEPPGTWETLRHATYLLGNKVPNAKVIFVIYSPFSSDFEIFQVLQLYKSK